MHAYISVYIGTVINMYLFIYFLHEYVYLCNEFNLFLSETYLSTFFPLLKFSCCDFSIQFFVHLAKVWWTSSGNIVEQYLSSIWLFSSDRSSYGDSVLLYLYPQATFWDFEHFFQYTLMYLMFYDVLGCSMMFYEVLWSSMMFFDVLWCSMS